MFYHIIFKNREICWQYGSRVNYNLDLRVVDGAPRETDCPPPSSDVTPFQSTVLMPATGGKHNLDLRVVDGAPKEAGLPACFFGRSASPACWSFGSLVNYDPCASTSGRCAASADLFE